MFVDQFIYKTGFEKAKIEYLIDILIDCYSNFLDYFKKTSCTVEDYKFGQWIDDCLYSYNKEKLLKCRLSWGGEGSIVNVLEGTKIICDGAFINVEIDKIIIPSSVKYIGRNAFPKCNHVKCYSQYFVVENGVFYTYDHKRIVKNISNTSCIFDIQDSVEFIDWNAFYGERVWAYDYPPYFFRISSKKLKPFYLAYARLLVQSKDIKDSLMRNDLLLDWMDQLPTKEKKQKNSKLRSTKIGFNESRFICDNVYVDEFGVVYSGNKKRLLCYPKELKLKTYELLSECEIIEDNAFNYSLDCDGEVMYIEGNKIVELKFPLMLKHIGQYGLVGLEELKIIYYNKKDKINCFKLLDNYKDFYVTSICNRMKMIPY